MKPRVLLDVDGVLADFIGEFLRVVHRETGVKVAHNDITTHEVVDSLPLGKTQADHVWHIFSMRNTAATMKPYPGAVEGAKKLMKVADVYFVTSPVKTSPRWCYDRTSWLSKHFGEAQARRVAYTSEKHIVQGDFLVDDRADNLEGWAKESPTRTPILWGQPWNKKSKLKRLSDWGTLLQVVKAWGN